MRLLPRRRVLSLVAAPAALAFPQAGAGVPAVRWRGSVLGARATLVLEQVNEGRARAIIERVLAEIDRLEGVFSLQRETSALSRLNRDGRLVAPPHELVDVLSEARRIHRLSAGMFDPSIQPLWRLHADAFARADGPSGGPSPREIERGLARTGFDSVALEPGEVRFTKPGMALTLNGIAQGAITDRIADLLRNEGLDHGLIDTGEIRAIGRRASGRRWPVALEARSGPAQRVLLDGNAVATSDPDGTLFGADRRHHHLLDPRTGRSSIHARPVSVIASRAVVADALSTALALMPPEGARAVAARAGPGVRMVRAGDSAF